jgi:hypothetical protein
MHNTAPQVHDASVAEQYQPVEQLYNRPIIGEPDEARGYNHGAEWAKTVQRANRYTTDGNVYVHSLPDDVRLNPTITASLAGEGIMLSHGTSGTGYASKEIAKVVSGQQEPHTLFGDGYTGKAPAKQTFEDMLNRKVGGEVGMMMTGLLMDAVYGYEKQEGDGYVVVPAMAAEDAFKVHEYGESSYTSEAQFCAKTEWHFAEDAPDLLPIEVDGQVVALQKTEGAHTALLLKPVIINGVRIPTGSIMNVTHNKQGEPAFAFGRLSPFCLSDPHEGVRQFPEIFNDLFTYRRDAQHMRGDVPAGYTRTLGEFNTAAGRPNEPGAQELLSGYMASAGYQIDPEVAARELIQQMDALLLDSPDDALRGEVTPIARIARGLKKENDVAVTAAEAAARDKALSDAGKGDPGERHALIAKTIQTRKMYYKFFGYKEVKRAERLIDLRDDLARMI